MPTIGRKRKAPRTGHRPPAGMQACPVTVTFEGDPPDGVDVAERSAELTRISRREWDAQRRQEASVIRARVAKAKRRPGRQDVRFVPPAPSS